MLEDLKKFEKEITRIKHEGYIKELKGGKNGALKTLNLMLDLEGVKSVTVLLKKDFTRKYMALFNAKLDNPRDIKRLCSTYGYFENNCKKNKVLKISVQANSSVLVGRFLFKLVVDDEKERVILNIYDSSFNLIESKTGWSYKNLKEKYYKKSKYIGLVKYWEQESGNIKYYRYYDYVLWELKPFEEFLKLLKDGTIRATFGVDIIKTGEKMGKINDRGISFEIQELDLEKLYEVKKLKDQM